MKYTLNVFTAFLTFLVLVACDIDSNIESKPGFSTDAEIYAVPESGLSIDPKLIGMLREEKKILDDMDAVRDTGLDKLYETQDLVRVRSLLSAYLNTPGVSDPASDRVHQYEMHAMMGRLLDEYRKANRYQAFEKADLVKCKIALEMSRIWLEMHGKGQRKKLTARGVYCPNSDTVSEALKTEVKKYATKMSEIFKREVEEDCQAAKKESKDIWHRCARAYLYEGKSRKELLGNTSVIDEFNTLALENKAEAVREIFLNESGLAFGTGKNFDEEIDFDIIAFAVDLYHTLPSGWEPPPIDITPTHTDKGLLWRSDEIIGDWSQACKSDHRNWSEWKKLKLLCDYYFKEQNLDQYMSPARLNRAVYPSATAEILKSRFRQMAAQ